MNVEIGRPSSFVGKIAFSSTSNNLKITIFNNYVKKHVIISHEKNNNRIDAHWSDESSPKSSVIFLSRSRENHVFPELQTDI